MHCVFKDRNIDSSKRDIKYVLCLYIVILTTN